MKKMTKVLTTVLVIALAALTLAGCAKKDTSPVTTDGSTSMEKVIGTLDYVDKIAGGHAGSLRPDGSIEAELQVITGATNEMGFNRLSAR